jgi:hypothetical protein
MRGTDGREGVIFLTPEPRQIAALAIMLTTRRALFLSLALTAFLSARGIAQAPATPSTAATLVPIPSRTYIGFNPVGLPADIATVEIENAVAQGITVGGVASYIDVDDTRFTTFDFKVRYYPGEIVLRDWSIGGTIGYTHFSNLVNGAREPLNAPTIGIVLDKNWIYGRSQHFLIGTGVGAKRVIASSADRDRADVGRAVVTARLIVGFAF